MGTITLSKNTFCLSQYILKVYWASLGSCKHVLSKLSVILRSFPYQLYTQLQLQEHSIKCDGYEIFLPMQQLPRRPSTNGVSPGCYSAAVGDAAQTNRPCGEVPGRPLAVRTVQLCSLGAEWRRRHVRDKDEVKTSKHQNKA